MPFPPLLKVLMTAASRHANSRYPAARRFDSPSRRGGDAQLYYINPYRFAAQRKVDQAGALRAFLHLTKGGLFNLYWNIHCPACKGVTQHSKPADVDDLATVGSAVRSLLCAHNGHIIKVPGAGL
jgi:hypothetical protein